MNDMITGAIAVHELYASYVKAGFNETQALELVKANIMAAGK